MIQTPRDINSHIFVASAHNATAQAAGTITGTAMDRMTTSGQQGFLSCVLHVSTGGSTGTPDSFSVAYAVEESADNSSWTAVSGATATITAANTQARVALDLSGRQRYIRASPTVTFVNGTSPTVVVAGVFVFGGALKEPPSSLTA